jgi:asparaginyl-tRNA synthetase
LRTGQTLRTREEAQLKTEQTTNESPIALDIPKPLDQLSDVELDRKSCIGRVMTYTLSNMTNYFTVNGFQWLLPVALSRSTDPLWPDPGASIDKRIEVDIYGETVRTTSSMIVHKLIASSLAYPKLFILSPNIRIEKAERARTGRHVYEFTQLDFEARGATSSDIMRLVEDAVSGLVESLKKDGGEDLRLLGRYDALKVTKRPFATYDAAKLEEEYGSDWEAKLVGEIKEPTWVINIPREFYDFEDFDSGRWDNYDLMMPGYGEVLSGSRRECEYEKMLAKMDRENVRKENFALILKLAKEGRVKPTAGAGIGIERIVGWITGAKHIGETQPFPKVPGTVYEL